MDTMPIALVTGFQGALLREGLADSTRQKYAQHVAEFVDHLGEDRVTAATRSDAEAYIDRLLVEQGLGVATVRLRIAALRRFYDYLEERDLLDDRSPFARIKAPKQRKKANDWLSQDEDEDMYANCVTPQERILHALLRYGGLRIGEATALQQRNVDLSRDELRVTVSKSDAGLRTIPMHPRLKSELEMWLRRIERQGRARPDLPLLVTSNLTPMKAQFGWRLIKRIAARAGVRPLPGAQKSSVTPHTLRRTFGTDLLNRGTRIETVSRLLGHADTRVTLDCYAELLPETIRNEAMEAWGA
jgi:integrase/recombinase XerD